MCTAERRYGEAERENRDSARKSLIAAANISDGEMFSAENVTVKRPGTGRSPMKYWATLGMRAEKQYQVDELI